jgi:mRNA interferase RelE/StbE
VTGDAEDRDVEAPSPYTVIFSRRARHNLHENLPLDVAAAAMETIEGPLTISPHRINEDKHTVEIHSIRHRRDAYRT